MKKKHLMLFFLLFKFVSGIFGQSPDNLIFQKDSTFKIVQFTDIHWVSGQEGNEADLAMMNAVLNVEKPDLVVFTGDIVLSEQESEDQLKKGWKEVTKPVREKEIPWVAVLGNHDSEGKVTRNVVCEVVSDLKYNINPKHVGSLHDFYLPVRTKDKKLGAVIYLFDSNDYPESFMPGKYAWITKKQIDNYIDTSDSIKSVHNNYPVPALAFFHIPIPEYKGIIDKPEAITGHAGEGVSSPDINSGLFSAMVLQGDVMGVFCGHDHNNDFIGELNHIALAYGRCSGTNAYGDYRNGARVIELHPNQFSFDTWIRIPSREEYHYHFPAGSLQTEDYLAAVIQPADLVQGIQYAYYEGEVNSVSEIKNMHLKKNGMTASFDIGKAEVEDHFAFVFDTYIKIPEKDVYTFYLQSDDGSRLFVDDQMVVDNDGGHSVKTEKGFVGLEKGYHHLKLLYFEDYMGQKLEVGIESSTIKKSVINEQMLFCE